MGLDNLDDLIQLVLTRADEIDAGGAASGSPFYGIMDELAGEVHRDLITRYPWLELMSDPPGVLHTVAPTTNLTLTISSVGAGVTGTLSSGPASSLAGYKIRPAGVTWAARITAHTAGSTSITLDEAPATITAGTASTIYQDEYTLAADLGTFVNGLWDQAGGFVRLVSLETLLDDYPDPPTPARTAALFARLTRRKIRLSQYPSAVRRYEYPYVAEISDPSGASTLTIPPHLRTVFSEGLLALLFQAKGDKRQVEAATRYEAGIERAIGYEDRRRFGWGQASRRTGQGGYADRRRFG